MIDLRDTPHPFTDADARDYGALCDTCGMDRAGAQHTAEAPTCEHAAEIDGAEAHSCYQDGSAVTLWPALWDTRDKNPKQRQTVALIEADGTRRAYNDHPATARGIYDHIRERLLDNQR